MSFRYRHGDRPLEGYTIQRGVGRGGFGEVYYAISDGGREVALKALLLNHEIELRGVRQCINLKNPHLVSIFDVRVTPDGLPFVIMEYVAGPSLRDLLHQNAEGLGPQKAGYLLREIGRGLAYLHDRGIVHRDLKPENIFYEDGYVKIGDYGLSKYISVSRQSGQTMSVGTVHYMAPEIGTGIYNRGIDIYALGIILFELLTGRVPFSGDSFGEIIMKHLTAKPDLGSVEEPFRSVLARALEKKPEDRFPTVEAMVEDLFREEALSSSVGLFNPASLTVLAKRGGPALVSPVAETLRIDEAGRPAGPMGGGGGAELAAEDGGPAVGLATPPPAGQPPQAPPRADAAPEHRLEPRSLPRKAPSGGDLDPLDEGQRRARAVFALSLATLAAVVFLHIRFVNAVGFLILTASCTACILLSEGVLARRFQVQRGPWRRLIAAVLAAPLAVLFGMGLRVFETRSPDSAIMALLIGIVLVNWGQRMSPQRDERISVASALSAAAAAFILALVFQLGTRGFFILGGMLATVSLALNALSPYIPPALRRRGLAAGAPRPAAEGPSIEAEAAPFQASPKPGRAAALSPGGRTGSPGPASRAIGRSWWACKHPRRALSGGKPGGEFAPSGSEQGGELPRRGVNGEGRAAALRRHERPVRPVFKYSQLALGGAAAIAGAICLIVTISTGEYGPFAGAVVTGTMGAFLLRQARRERRGTLWGGTLRPFLLFGSTGALMICAALYAEYHTMGPGEREALWQGSSLAIAAWILAFILRSPIEERRMARAGAGAGASAEAAAGPVAGESTPVLEVHRGWAALGILLWMAGFAAAITATAASVGILETAEIRRELDRDLIQFLPAGAWSLTLNLLVAASACVIVSRRRAGIRHISRAVVGQAALGLMMALIYALSQEVRVTPYWGLEFRHIRFDLLSYVFAIMAAGTLGAVSVAWPLSEGAKTAPVEGAPPRASNKSSKVFAVGVVVGLLLLGLLFTCS